MSREIRALNRIEDFMSKNAVHYKQDVGYIREALIQKMILDKALKIMKSKPINLVYFVDEIRADNNKRTYSDYLYWSRFRVKTGNDILTEEEFNLLREVLK